MLGESGVVCDAVEGGRVEFGKGGMRVGAVETFLVAIDPGGFLALVGLGGGENRRDRNGKWEERGRRKKGTDMVFQLKRPV